jgi:hypothetical protein
MTPSIPFTLPDTATGPDIAGRRPAAGQQLTRPQLPFLALVGPSGHGSQSAPPGRPADRSGLWLRNAATGLGVLAASATAVSFTANGTVGYQNCLNALAGSAACMVTAWLIVVSSWSVRSSRLLART